MSVGEIYKLTVVPSYARYTKDNFGIYEFYTEEKGFPYLSEQIKDNDIWDFSDGNENKTKIVYTGIMLGVSQTLDLGLPYKLTAKLEFSDKFKSYQYKIVNISPIKPQSSVENKRFLYTILTEKQTNTLLDSYPNIIDEVINNHDFTPDYTRLSGIKEKSFKKIRQKILDTYLISDLLIMLQPLGVTYNMILKLLDGEQNGYLLKQQLEENPYELTRLHGVGFQSIDKFAIKLKPELLKSKQRVIACIKYLLKDIGNSEGHSWIEIDKLTQLVKNLVPECRDIYKEIINMCRQECLDNKPSFLYADQTRVGLFSNYSIEKSISKKLWDLQNSDNLYIDVDYDEAIIKTNMQNGFELTKEQCEAVKSVIDNNITIITGNAGTGKTSIIKAIINLYSHYDIALTALSAKAARRMSEVTGANAMTIHRLLEYDAKGFKKNCVNPLYQKLIIIDEASMINSNLFLSLLDAISNGSKVVIVFDFAQLSPIGVGNVASDLLVSELPLYKFTKIHRQAEKSGILVDANKIRIGESPITEFDENIISGELEDMIYYFREQSNNNDTYEQLNNLALKVFKELLDRKIDIDDISVIVPRKQSVMNSVNYFNKKMQDIVIKDKVPYLEFSNKQFKLGAKVIQKVNDYSKDVVNGEIGYITEILKPNKDNSYDFIIDFGDGKVIKYKRNELEQIDLAYAITAHSCLLPNTYILSDNGFETMEDIKVKTNSSLNGHNEINKINIYNGKYMESPTHFINSGVLQCYHIKSSLGFSLEASYNHYVDVLSVNGEIKKKLINEVNIGDYICISKNSQIFGDYKTIPESYFDYLIDCRGSVYKKPQFVTEELGELLGLICADGTVFHSGIRISKKYKDVVQRFSELMRIVFGVNSKVIRDWDDNTWECTINSVDISTFLKKFGGLNPNNKYVPKLIMQSPKYVQQKFIKGYMEDSGISLKNGKLNQIEFCQRLEKPIKQMQLLLLNMGIICSKKTCKDRYSLYIYGRNAIKYGKEIGFVSSHKNKTLAECLKSKYVNERKSIPYITSIVKFLIDEYKLIVNPNIYLAVRENKITPSMLSRFLNSSEDIIKDTKQYKYLKMFVDEILIDKIIEKSDIGLKDTVCLVMPETHKFVQNGIYGWNSQGSQYKYVIVVLDISHFILLDTCLFYTAITRASKECYCIAQPKAFIHALSNSKAAERQTFLKELIVKDGDLWVNN